MAWENDLLERKAIADFIHNLLEGDSDIKVVNIDSAWGTGKTFFLENWRDDLSGKRGVVYFNAWERDYTGDPFVSLVSAIKHQLEEQVGSKGELKKRFEDFSQKASKAIVNASPVVAKAIFKGMVRKYVGVDVDDVGESIKDSGAEDGVADEAVDLARGVADEAAIKAVQSLIESNEDAVNSVDDFRRVFEGLVTEVGETMGGKGDPLPVYVFVDELDRCRPTYAIELLERIKHFLDVPHCKFVIATDTKQLCHSIKAVYGSGFNSFGYLKRFFDITYTLDNSDLSDWIYSKVKFSFPGVMNCLELSIDDCSGSRSAFFMHNERPVSPDHKTIISPGGKLGREQIIIHALCKTFRVSLREMDKIVLHINAALLGLSRDKVHFFFLAYLVFLKNTDPDTYEKFLGDEEGALYDDLAGKYPAYNLYFTFECLSVHDLAREYLHCSFLSRVQLRDRMNSYDNDACQYKVQIPMDAFNGEAYLSYAKVVDLASHLS